MTLFSVKFSKLTLAMETDFLFMIIKVLTFRLTSELVLSTCLFSQINLQIPSVVFYLYNCCSQVKDVLKRVATGSIWRTAFFNIVDLARTSGRMQRKLR